MVGCPYEGSVAPKAVAVVRIYLLVEGVNGVTAKRIKTFSFWL